MGSVLAGRRVVVTRAVEQADDLAVLLQQSGAIPVVIPLIEFTSEPAGVAQLARYAAEGFAEFDWVIVTSPNGAACLVAAVSDEATQPVAARIAAVGTTTAEVLRAAGIEVNFVPTVQSAAGLLAEFPPDRGLDSGSGTGLNAVLIVQAANAEPTLADGLRELRPSKSPTGSAVAAVAVVTPYRTIATRVDAGQQLAALSADAVMFASGSAARAWVAVFGDSAPPVVVAIGPQTASSATRAGLKVSVVATDHSMSGMVMALERHLSSHR
jgi:uroporphyrinogen-III synthase